MKKKIIFTFALALIALHYHHNSNSASNGVILQDYDAGDTHRVDFGIIIPERGICNNARPDSACTQNAMEIGPLGSKGFNKVGKDAFRFKYPYSYMNWYEVNPNNKKQIYRNCKAYFDTAFMISNNSNIYFDGNCQLHIWEADPWTPHRPVKVKCITSTGACCPGFTCNEPF